MSVTWYIKQIPILNEVYMNYFENLIQYWNYSHSGQEQCTLIKNRHHFIFPMAMWKMYCYGDMLL